MAHQEQLEFVRLVSVALPFFFRDSRVLEVGSLDINGTVRPFFTNCTYTGLDIAPGPGVDVVCQGQDYDAATGSFDTVISCEAMEHNPHWRETFANMIRLCRPGGLVVMTCATIGRHEHGTARTDPQYSPNTTMLGWDYYRNLSSRDFDAAFKLRSAFRCYRFFSNWDHFDLYFCGIRPGVGASGLEAEGWGAFLNAVHDWLEPYNRSRRARYRRALARLFGDRSFVWQRMTVRQLHDGARDALDRLHERANRLLG